MSKKEEKVAVEKKKLELKKDDQLKKIRDRVASVDQIADSNPGVDELQILKHKFEESYEKRKIFSEELLKSRQNCGELKSKIQKFVKQQNMLMIKLKSTASKGAGD